MGRLKKLKYGGDIDHKEIYDVMMKLVKIQKIELEDIEIPEEWKVDETLRG